MVSFATLKTRAGLVAKRRPSYALALRILNIKPPLFVDTPRPAIQYLNHQKKNPDGIKASKPTEYLVNDSHGLIFGLVDALEPLVSFTQEQKDSCVQAQYAQAGREATKFFRLCKQLDPGLRPEPLQKVMKHFQNWRDRAEAGGNEIQKIAVQECARAMVKIYLVHAPEASGNLIAHHVRRILQTLNQQAPSLRTLHEYVSQGKQGQSSMILEQKAFARTNDPRIWQCEICHESNLVVFGTCKCGAKKPTAAT